MNKRILIVLICILLFSINSVGASERITASPSDYFAYYGMDTPAGQTHSFAVVVDGDVYYISDYVANKLAAYSYYFNRVYDYDLSKFSDKFTPDAISFGSNGFNAFYQLNNEKDDEMFQFPNDQTFDFEYVSGQRVGYNKNAKVVTKVYYHNGNEITDTLY